MGTKRVPTLPVGASLKHAQQLCRCGCQVSTALAKTSDRRVGRIAGEPLRYIRGHHRKKPNRYIAASTGYRTKCWIWQLAKNADGYGCSSGTQGRIRLAHREYYERLKGPIPINRQLDHLCRVRACVNPDHLEPVTSAENCRRGRGTKLTPSDVREIRTSSERQRALADQYGVTQGHVSRIKSGQTWR